MKSQSWKREIKPVAKGWITAANSVHAHSNPASSKSTNICKYIRDYWTAMKRAFTFPIVWQTIYYHHPVKMITHARLLRFKLFCCCLLDVLKEFFALFTPKCQGFCRKNSFFFLYSFPKCNWPLYSLKVKNTKLCNMPIRSDEKEKKNRNTGPDKRLRSVS